jgi:hypothetical protein
MTSSKASARVAPVTAKRDSAAVDAKHAYDYLQPSAKRGAVLKPATAGAS